MGSKAISTYLDATYLSLEDSLETQKEKVTELCNDVVRYNLRGACVRTEWVSFCKTLLENTNYEIACVIAFPDAKSTTQEQTSTPTFGVIPTAQKTEAIKMAFALGATEVDVVLNTSFYLLPQSEMQEAIYTEVSALQVACAGKRLKLILECDLLPDDKLQKVIEACLKAKVDCLKNATGYIADGRGATLELIQSMREQINRISPDTLLKASAGIKTAEKASQLIELGANIIGTSSIAAILELNLHGVFESY